MAYKRNTFRNKTREGYLGSPIEETSVMKLVDARYFLGFYNYMLNLIDMIRIDEDTETELQPEGAFIPICG